MASISSLICVSTVRFVQPVCFISNDRETETMLSGTLLR
jgi:hypothetical protein